MKRCIKQTDLCCNDAQSHCSYPGLCQIPHVATLVSVNSTKEKTTKDDIVVEMKTNTKNEDTVLLKAVNGDKKVRNDQVTIVVGEYDVIISQYKKASKLKDLLACPRGCSVHNTLQQTNLFCLS